MMELSQDTRLEVTLDTGLGTFPSNPLSRTIFKPNLIAYCVTGTHNTCNSTRRATDTKPWWWRWLCLVRASSYNQQSPWRQASSRHHQPSLPPALRWLGRGGHVIASKNVEKSEQHPRHYRIWDSGLTRHICGHAFLRNKHQTKLLSWILS